jgi:hypothetical protein
LEKYSNASEYELNDMIHPLYSAALSEKIYRVINHFVEKKKNKKTPRQQFDVNPCRPMPFVFEDLPAPSWI